MQETMNNTLLKVLSNKTTHEEDDEDDDTLIIQYPSGKLQVGLSLKPAVTTRTVGVSHIHILNFLIGNH